LTKKREKRRVTATSKLVVLEPKFGAPPARGGGNWAGKGGKEKQLYVGNTTQKKPAKYRGLSEFKGVDQYINCFPPN